MAQVGAADQSLASGQVAAAVDAAAGSGQALRSLAAALAGQPVRDVLADGAPPIGRLAAELVSRGSAVFTGRACKSCGATGQPLTRSSGGGVCSRCRNRLLATACVRCGTVKPVACRTGSGQPVCERCRRHERGHRRCGTCGKTAPISSPQGPRRARGRVRELLPHAAGRLHGLRPPAAVQLRRRRQSGLQDMRAARHELLRAMRPGPASGRALARGPSLRHLLHQRAAPPRRLRGLPPGATADRAARPRRDHVRGLRRTATHPSVRAVRHEDKLFEKGRCARCRPPRPGLGPDGRGRSGSRAHRRRRGHRGGPEPLLGSQLAADRRCCGHPR